MFWGNGKGVILMTVRIEDSCTACGLCVDTCPDVFQMGDDKAEVITGEVPAELEDAVQQAADECPAEAIIVE
jgi:ferredoxin